MRQISTYQGGFSTLSVVIGSAIVALIGATVLHGISQNRRVYHTYEGKAVAETLASEGLEFFAAMTTEELQNYLRRDPMTNTLGTNYRFPLCEKINFLNRTTQTIQYQDALMDLPVTPLGSQTVTGGPNRYYQVRVVKLTGSAPNITVNEAACNTTAPYVFNDPQERFMVTVGVTWMLAGRTIAKEESTALSTVLAVLVAPPSAPGRVLTQKVGVVFEDSVRHFPGDWDERDIKACITGNFEVDPATHQIFPTSPIPQLLTIVSERNTTSGCYHEFHIEVYDSSGNLKHQEAHATQSEPAPPVVTTITVQRGDEIRLSWNQTGVYGSMPIDTCVLPVRDYNTRIIDTVAGKNLPAPKFYYDECGDWSL